jgi:phosphohistidine phosphatase
MNRELLLVRHGRAERPNGDDRTRRLTNDGKRDIQRLGAHLQVRGWLPDIAVASPAVRARTTAEKMLKAAAMTTECLSIEHDLYEATCGELLAVLERLPEVNRVILVGHNPAVEQTSTFLGGSSAAFEPGMLARILMPASWTALAPGSAEIAAVVRPVELPEKFPFPGGEPRDRPAYYYTQSAILPFRRTDAGLEFLVIGSSGAKHHVIPKGIVDPGMSPRESAAREAREEAGVGGRILDEPVGEIRYDKWGASCRCTVFAMEVTEVIAEPEWRERHRGRAWFGPEDAARRLRNPAIGELVLALCRRLTTAT